MNCTPGGRSWKASKDKPRLISRLLVRKCLPQICPRPAIARQKRRQVELHILCGEFSTDAIDGGTECFDTGSSGAVIGNYAVLMRYLEFVQKHDQHRLLVSEKVSADQQGGKRLVN